MIKIIKKTVLSIVLFFFILISLLFFILSTTPGLSVLAVLSTLCLPGTLSIHGIQGHLWNQFTISELNYQKDTLKIKAKNVLVTWQLSSLAHVQLPIKTLNADSLELQQNNSRYIVNNIKLSGLLTQQSIALDLLRFSYMDQSIVAQLKINPQSPYSLTSTIKLNPLTKNKQQLNGALNIAGDSTLVRWTGDFNGLGTLSLKGTLDHLSQLKQSIKWRDLEWRTSPTEILKSPEGTLNLSGTLPDINVQFTSKINRTVEEQWHINAAINGTMPWLWNFDIAVTRPYDSESRKEGLYTRFFIKGTLKDKNKGHINLTVNPGHYQMAKDSPIPSLAFQGGTIKATLSPKDFIGSGSLGIDDYKKINIAFKLPKCDLSKGVSDTQPLSADISLLLNSFDFLQALSPEIKNPKGTLALSLKTRGTIGKPKFESNLLLSKASVQLPSLGLTLNALDLLITGKEKQWEGTGLIATGDKKISIKGQGTLAPEIKAKLSLQGSDFPLMNTNEYQIKISPQLQLNYTKELLDISGTVLVPFAQIKPQSFSNSIDLSEDVVFKTKLKEKKSQTSLNTQMKLKVEMGKEVELTAKGLHATLNGTVNITEQPQGPVSATGELNVIEGKYKAYGQDLAIEQGTLFFTGGRIDNPGINVRAAKKIDTSSTTVAGTNQLMDFNNNNLENANVRGTIDVGVEVTGRLTEPKIHLFANPSILSQADILSMLVLGRPASQANKAGGQLLLAAISSMNLSGGTSGTQLLEQLKQNLGLDFNVQSTSNYNLVTNTVSDNTAFVVSKSLSKRISLSYNVGLSQADPNVLTLKYLLNKFFSIQISSSNTSNGLDVLYTSNKK